MSSTKPNNLLKRVLGNRIGIFIALLGILILWAFVAPAFYSSQNISNLLRTSTTNILITLGMTYTLIAGGIDLTVGRTAALTGVVTTMAILAGIPWYFAVSIGLIVGVSIGAVNGIIVAFTNIPPFIATIAMQFVIRGLAFSIGSGSSIMVSDPGFYTLGNEYLFGIPIPVIVLGIVAIFLHTMLKYTSLGDKMESIGENEKAAKYAGVNIKKVKIITYMVSGFTAGLAGIILSSRMMSGQPVVGDGFDADAIASAVIGGVSISGGTGSVFGGLLGALIMGILVNGLNIWGVNSYWQNIIKGTIILMAVIIDAYSKNRPKKV